MNYVCRGTRLVGLWRINLLDRGQSEPEKPNLDNDDEKENYYVTILYKLTLYQNAII
jgi:hypothetical protein